VATAKSLSALFNPKTSILIQKRHPYTGNLNSETLGDSKHDHEADLLVLILVRNSVKQHFVDEHAIRIHVAPHDRFLACQRLWRAPVLQPVIQQLN